MTSDETKTKSQLLSELAALRTQITKLEALEIKRRQVEQTLKTQAQVLENMAEGVNVTDEQAIIFYTNPAFDTMFGYQLGELSGNHVSIFTN